MTAAGAGLAARVEGTVVGDLLESLRRTRAVDMSYTIAAQAFVALFPLVLVVTGAFTANADDSVFARELVDRFGLAGAARLAVEQLFTTPSSGSGVYWLGLLITLLSAVSLARRVTRLLRGNDRRELVRDMVVNRGQYASFITLLSAGIILSTASFLVLQFESRSADANIHTGADAIWWGVVTITTVGYGDRFPVTLLGRLVGLFVMLTGVGIIAALASILASLLVPPPAPEEGTTPANTEAGVDAARLADELASLRAEVTALRAEIRR